MMEALETRDEKLQFDFLKKYVHSEFYRQSDGDVLIGSYLNCKLYFELFGDPVHYCEIQIYITF